MNENINENIENVVVDSVSDVESVSSSVGNSDSFGFSVSSGDAGTSSVVGTDTLVSNGVTVLDTFSVGDTTSQVLVAEEIIPHLEKIEYNQTALIFILLFIWCERKVKNAVRGFTGRGLDE